MFCSNCGKENADGMNFCIACGAPLTPVQPEAPSQDTTVLQPEMSAEQTTVLQPEDGQTAGVYDAPVYGQPPVSPETSFEQFPAGGDMPAPPSKKGKKTKIIVIVLCAVLALALVIGGIVFAFLPKIQRAVMGEAEYYLYKEFENISTAFDAGEIAKLRHPDTYSADSTLEIKADDGYDEITAEALSTMSGKAKVNYDKAKGAVSVESDFVFDGDEMFGLDFNYDDGKFAVSSDELDSALSIGGKSGGSGESSGSKESASKPSASDAKDILDAFKPILDETFNENCETSKEEYDGKKCDVVTFKIEDEQMEKLVVEVLKLAKDSAADYEYFNYAFGLLAGDFTDFGDMIDDMIEEIEEVGFDFDDLEYKVYYSSRGDVLCRKLVNSDDDEIIIKSSIDKNDSTISIEVCEDDDVIIAVDYEKTIKDSKLNASLSVKDEENTGFNFEATDVEVKEIGGVNAVVGSFKVKFDDGWDAWSVSGNGEADGDTYNIALNFDIDETKIDAKITTKLDKSASVSDMPSNAEYDDFEEFFEDFSIEAENKLEEKFNDYFYSKYSDYYGYY